MNWAYGKWPYESQLEFLCLKINVDNDCIVSPRVTEENE